MKITLQFITKNSNYVDSSKWNQDLLKSEYALAPQTANWQYAFKEKFNSEPFFISVFNSQNVLLGQLAGVIHQEFFWKDANLVSRTIGKKLNLGRILYWLYGPIIYKQSFRDEILEQIINRVNELANEKKVSLITGFTSPMSEINQDIWKKFGFHLQPWKTYIMDLKPSIDTLYKSLHKKVRYDIRKAEKEGFELEIVKEKKSLMEYHDLRIRLKKMQWGKVGNNAFFDSRWRLLHRQGFAQLIVARLKGKMVGGVQVLNLNKNVIQHVVGTLPKYPMSGTFLTWNAIKWAKQKEFLTFDFGGANPSPNSEKEKRIDFFKSKWKGRQFEYYVCTKKVNPIQHNLSTVLKNPSKISQVIKKRLKSQ